MKVIIGSVTIPDAEVKRFIDLESGLPLSMIKVSFIGEGFNELGKAFQENSLLPFECEIIKTQVLVYGSSHKENKHEYILMERAVDVSSGFKLVFTEIGNEKAMMLPLNTRSPHDYAEELRKLPFIRLILKRDIPSRLLE